MMITEPNTCVLPTVLFYMGIYLHLYLWFGDNISRIQVHLFYQTLPTTSLAANEKSANNFDKI